MADLHVLTYSSFLCCFTQGLVSLLPTILVKVPFSADLARLYLKLKHNLMRKLLQ